MKGLIIMSSPSRPSYSPRARRRSNITAAGLRRPAMSEQQLAAYLAARDAVRRANRISQLLPYRTRQELSAFADRRTNR